MAPQPTSLATDPCILFVDPERSYAQTMSFILKSQGYDVHHSIGISHGLLATKSRPPDLIILGHVPHRDLLSAIGAVRRSPEHAVTPILVITQAPDERVETTCLDGGADGFLSDPVSPERFLSHVRALIRRHLREDPIGKTLTIHDLHIDRRKYTVTRSLAEGTEEVHLPRRAFDLLYFLTAHAGRVFTREELLDRVWGSSVYVVDRTIDVHIRRIREKLGSEYLETVKGVGYRFRS